MSPVAISGTDTPLDTLNPDVNYTALGLARQSVLHDDRGRWADGTGHRPPITQAGALPLGGGRASVRISCGPGRIAGKNLQGWSLLPLITA